MISLQKNKALARALVAAGFTCALMANSPAMAANKKDKQAAQTAEAARIEELAKQVEALVAQNKALQDKVQKLEVAQTQQSSAVQQQAATVQQQGIQVQQQAQAVEKVQQEVSAANAHASEAAATVVSSYGEIGYSHPTKSAKDTSVDIQRAVIGMQHRFDDKTKMVSEFEWEHAITSASDKGEAEVEQLWIEREFQPDLRGRVGLFLMPVGLLNKNHEPTAYYGVFRPDVDTKIIPSTWREVGLGLSGDLANGLNWDVALTTAPNLSKWDPTTTEGRDRGPLQAIHGEGQYAAARDLGVVGALNWQGVPGLLVGGSVVYDSIGQHQPNFPGNDSKLLLWDVHTRYQIAGWDLAAEYARGTISHTEALNTSFIAGTTPNPTLVPHLFYGGYVQAAYKLWQSGDYTLLPFARYELLNTAADFGSLAGGVKSPDEHIWTTGANLRIGDGVVLKADYRNYSQNKLPDAVNHFNLGNSFNLGAGFSF